MKTRLLRRASAGALALTLIGATAAFADNLQDDIVDNGTGVTLVAGSSTPGTANIRVIGNRSGDDTNPGCNFDADGDKITLDIVTPTGVTANPDPLVISSCGTDYEVSFTAASNAQSGTVTVSITSNDTDGTFMNQVSIPITVTHANTPPTVEVTGVTDGATYEFGSVPAAGCLVTDSEDESPSATPSLSAITGPLADYDLGQQTATCTYTDGGGLSASDSATYTIADTTKPTITFVAQNPGANANGWNNSDVTVTWSCTDNLQVVDATVSATVNTEGQGQSAIGTCADVAGNTASDTRSGINIDKTAPNVSVVGGPADEASYYFGFVPGAPTCTASDAISGLDGDCSVTGYSTALGTHELGASAKDLAGNTGTAETKSYTVLAWTLNGFFRPVDMGGVLNTVKAGSTVPLKFQVFAGSTELTATSMVKSFVQTKVNCDSSAIVDEIDLADTTTGATSLRYDATGGQFVQNWQTPKSAGSCYIVTMTTQDGSTLKANFKLK